MAVRFLESYIYEKHQNYSAVANQLKADCALSALRGVNGKDAVKVFVKAGRIVRKGKGDHANIKMPNGQLITIPVSGNLKIGLLKSVTRKSGLDDEEFLRLFKRMIDYGLYDPDTSGGGGRLLVGSASSPGLFPSGREY